MYWYVRIGDAKYFIPKPFEVGAIATVAERSLEQMIDDSVDGEVFAERIAHVVLDTFAFNPTPQMVKPLVDLYSNKNRFTGRTIETMGMERLSKLNRRHARTSELGKGTSWVLDKTLGNLSKNLVVSPIQADYLVQQYLGWVGTMGATTVDVISKTAQGYQSPAKEWYEYNPVRRFYRDSSIASYTRYGTEFYKLLREVNTTYADVQHLRKMGKDEQAAELMVENKDKLRSRKLLAKTQRRLSKLNVKTKLIHADKTMRGGEKRRRLDLLLKQKTQLQERIVKKLRGV